jgi:hypothetical protein
MAEDRGVGILPLALTPLRLARGRSDFGQDDRVKKVSCLISSSGAVPSPTHFEFANVICGLICAAARDGMSLGRGFLVFGLKVARIL